MIDDAIKLISVTYKKDEYANQKEVLTERTVFCKVRTVTRSEFYGAGTESLRPDFVFVLADYREYEGEKFCKYIGFDGKERTYKITRTYVTGSEIELTARERVQSNEL